MTLSELARAAVEQYVSADRWLQLSTEDSRRLRAVAQANGQTATELLQEAIEIIIGDAPAEVETVNPFIAKARRAS
jgi:hypothetical protein